MPRGEVAGPYERHIVTGEQSLFDYFITPVKQSFSRAFREE
jgi:hypothetical protein